MPVAHHSVRAYRITSKLRVCTETWRCHEARAVIFGETTVDYRDLACFLQQRLHSTQGKFQLRCNNYSVASKILPPQFPQHTICCALLYCKPLIVLCPRSSDVTTSLRNLSQCLIAFSENKCLLVSNLNLPGTTGGLSL